jgi:cyclopropane fatty-acyl-phospholipid synthase-like methyltransferase
MPQMSASSVYRWNTNDFATGYDEAAPIVHPHYAEVQGTILALLSKSLGAGGLVIDLGGGSGRLIERILVQFPQVRSVIIDQSEPFLALAERRLAPFGARARCVQAKLQNAWEASLAERAVAIVSMSAIHHLEPAEKKSVYARCYSALASGGVLLNGDEVRAADDDAYFAAVSAWAEYMRQEMAAGTIPASFHDALHGWIDRNVTRFGEEKKSGDDCHETIEAQLEYFLAAGFTHCDVPWQRDLWAVMRGFKG